MSPEYSDAIDAYDAHLLLDRGLSDNKRTAYAQDLTRLAAHH